MTIKKLGTKTSQAEKQIYINMCHTKYITIKYPHTTSPSSIAHQMRLRKKNTPKQKTNPLTTLNIIAEEIKIQWLIT